MEQKDNEKHKTTDLSKHKKEGSILKPPFLTIPKMRTSSWIDERLPEMLWAILLHKGLGREKALEVYRNVGLFVQTKDFLSDVSISGIATWPEAYRLSLFKGVFGDPETQKALKPLLMFLEMPVYDDWKFLGEISSEEEEKELAGSLVESVAQVLWHQSQEATDCRWAWLLPMLVSGKMKVPRDMFENITQYPNKGDMRSVRPSIRASEIAMHLRENPTDWPEKFWLMCHQNTMCLPIPREDNYNEKVDINLLHEDIREIQIELMRHFMLAEKNSKLEHKHAAIFGLAFYVLRLMVELTITNFWKSATARITLRTIAEAYITCAYLIKNDSPDTWRGFLEYGSGKTKQAYLKLRDLGTIPPYVNIKLLEEIANEDKWEEFVAIELGHWDKTSLREMSDIAGCKDIYDKYYDWTSAYTHGNWGAIREAVIDKCSNPLHRLHKFPSMGMHRMPSIVYDAVDLTNKLLNLLEGQYPDFPLRLKVPLEESSMAGVGRLRHGN